MTMEDDLPKSWPNRLHGAWQALAGQSGGNGAVQRAPAPSGRANEHPHARLIESLIAGLPGAAITLDRDGGVIAFNDAARLLAPALRRGEPALISLRMPELVDAIRRASKSGEP
ncbi:MAG TPA: hypothetical protein VGM57_09815, partial [Pseudolabrys sp.]